MKRLTFAILLGLLLSVPLKAQSTTEQLSATPSATPAPGNPPPPPPRGPMANLTDVERQQLKAAHDKAIQQNPALEEAMKAAHQVMDKARKDLNDAMIAVDPSVASVIAKIAPPKREGGPHGLKGALGGGEKKGDRHRPPGLANLTDAERQQLEAAHDKVKTDPSVVAAHDAMKSASTPEARRSAGDALRQAVDAAMLKVDPALGPILDKLHQAPPPPPQQGQPPQDTPPGMTQSPQ
jgi:Spy/CpxP family protein refolding chaperone